MPLVPVLTIEDAGDAGDLANALQNVGLTITEVTMRIRAAFGAIANMKKAAQA